jgi:SAM-dependent methyltransferase
VTGSFQQRFYDQVSDYRRGSPHLSHVELQDHLLDTLLEVTASLIERGLPLTALEVGAGHGAFTGPVLAMGYRVQAVEMSGRSARELRRRFVGNDRLHVIHDPEGSLAGVDGTHSLVLGVSVLHHIPDYLAAVGTWTDKVARGGSLVTFQDPLWYPTADAWALRLNAYGFALWRLRQGDLRTALRNRWRRSRGAYDPTEPSDMVEYHVVRQGVDSAALCAALSPGYESVETIEYWSHQSRWFHQLGTQLKLANTFGLLAQGRSADR